MSKATKPRKTWLARGKRMTARQIVALVEREHPESFDCFDQPGVVAHWLTKAGMPTAKSLAEAVGRNLSRRCTLGIW